MRMSVLSLSKRSCSMFLLNPVCQAHTHYDRQHSSHHAGQNISPRAPPFSILHQPHGLKRKSRKCCESAQKTYGYSYAPFGWDGQMPDGILSDPPEQKTSEQIYDQGTGGETGANALFHQALQSVSG